MQPGRDRSPLDRRGWGAVGTAASAVAIAACAWLATNPGASPRYDLPTVEWLQPTPDNNLVPAVLVASLVLALFSFWFRRRGRRIRPQVGIAVTTVVAIALGVSSYLPCKGTESWVALAVWVAGLFAIQVETYVIGPGAAMDAVCHGPYPLTFQVARLFGFAAIAITAFAILFSLVQSHLDHLLLSLRGGADIVTGLTPDSLPLVGSLAVDRVWDRRPTLVVVLPDGDAPLAHQARELGARVWVGDPLSGNTLRWLVLTPFGRVSVRRLFAVSESQSENIDVVMGSRKLIEDHTRADGSWLSQQHVPRLVARFSDAREARDWRLENVNAPGCFLDSLAPDELIARQIADRLGEAGSVRLVLTGDTPLTTAILDEIALQRCLRDELVTTIEKYDTANRGAEVVVGSRGPRPQRIALERVDVVGPTAVEVVRDWDNTAPPGSSRPSPLKVAATAASWEHATSALGKTAETALVVTDPAAPSISSRAMRLSRAYRDLLVIRPSRNVQGVSALTEAHASDAVAGPVIRYGRSLISDGSTPADSWTVLARQQHEVYCAVRGAYATTQPSPARLPWGTGPISGAQLSNFYRDDNLRQQRLVLLFLAERGYRWITVSAKEEVQDVAEPDLWALARAEHQRWCDFRLRQGWRHPSIKEGDRYGAAPMAVRRRNTNLVDWFTGASLPVPELAPPLSVEQRAALRSSNRNTLAGLIDRLHQWGIAPTGGPDWQRYRRIGMVQAKPLTESLKWRLPTGEVLTSRAGDYWVWSGTSSGRGVDATTFAATHRAVEGHQGWYERVDTYWARQLETPLACMSQEGPQHGQPGMWLVQDAAGSEWFVRDVEFSSGYEPEPEEAVIA